uniref:Uncharacterized protein n=1 Tax=Glossina brevipalpis TaxID=37001 RepID=A0A1A9WF13_9MUSC
MPWEPSTDFEDEIVNLQPQHDFIFASLSEPSFQPRPQAHIDYAISRQKKSKSDNKSPNKVNSKLELMEKIHHIAGTKRLGEQTTLDDWNDDTTLEQESIALMRYCGFNDCTDVPLNSNITYATHPVKTGVEIARIGNGRTFPIFFDEDLFELKPKTSISTRNLNNVDNNSNADIGRHSLSNNKDNRNLGLPPVVTTTPSNDVSLCTDDSDKNSNAHWLPYYQAKKQRHRLLLGTNSYNNLDDEASSISEEQSCYDTACSSSAYESSNETSFKSSDSWPALATSMKCSKKLNVSNTRTSPVSLVSYASVVTNAQKCEAKFDKKPKEQKELLTKTDYNFPLQRFFSSRQIYKKKHAQP